MSCAPDGIDTSWWHESPGPLKRGIAAVGFLLSFGREGNRKCRMSQPTRGGNTMSKKAAPKQKAAPNVQTAPEVENVLSTPEAPAAPEQANPTAEDVLSVHAAPLQAQEMIWESLSADQQAAVIQAQQILAPVEAVLNDDSAAKVFAQVGGTAVERLRKLRDEQTRARLIKKAGGKDASTRVQEMETAQQDLLEKRAAQILQQNGKDKTVAVKMKPSQAWEQACAEQGKVTATFVAFERRGAADRILQAVGLGNNYQPALPSAE